MAKELAVSLVIGATLSAAYQAAFGGAKRTLTELGQTVKTLEGKHKSMAEAMDRGLKTLSGGSLAALNRDYEKLGRTLDTVREKQKKLADSLAQGASLKAARQEHLGNLRESAGMTLAVGAPMFGAVRQAVNFEDQIKDIAITGNLTAGDEKSLGAAVRKAALSTNQTTDELNKGLGIMVANGMNPNEAGKYMGLLGETATASRASMEDLSQLMFSLYNQQGIQTEEDMRQALNDLVHAGKQGQFELKHMARYFPELGAQMASFGSKGLGAVRELGMAMQIARKYSGTNEEAARNAANWFSHMTAKSTVENFGKLGIDYQGEVLKRTLAGQSAMLASLDVVDGYIDKVAGGARIETRNKKGKVTGSTDFRGALDAAAKSGNEDEVKALVSRFGLSDVLQDMQTVNFYLAMRQGRGQFEAGMKSYDSPEAKGVLDKDAEKRMKSSAEQLKAFRINLTELGIALGNTLLPVLNQILPPLTSMLKGLAGFAERNPGITRSVVGLAAGMMGLRTAFFGLKFLGNFAFLAPANRVITGWAALTGRVALFRATLAAGAGPGTAFLRFLGVIASAANRVGPALARIGGVVLRLGGALRIAGQAALWLGRALLMTPIGLAITIIAGGALLIWKYWAPIKSGFTWLWGEIKTGFQSADPVGVVTRSWGRVRPYFSLLWSGVRSVFRSIWGEIKTAFSGGIAGVSRLIINWSPLGLFYRAFAAVMKYFGIDMPKTFSDFGSHLIDGLVNGIKGRLTAAKDTIVGFGQDIKGWFSSTLGIKSPSRVFMGFGGFIGEGLSIGISNSVAGVKKAAAGLAAATLIAPAAPAMTGFHASATGTPATGSGMVIHFSPQITISGGDPTAVRGQVTQALQGSQADLESMLRRVLAQQQRRSN